MLDQEDNAYFTKLAQIIQLKGWGRLTKKDILKDCPEQLRDFAVVTPPKQALWKYLFWLVDKNLEHISQGVSTKVSVHDILLEGVMTIFDTIQPYKAFLRLAFFSGTTQS
ncbi:MAG: hypothetical protein J0G29_00180, partial [Alphaproteobacteria bacterium]|nr:hypothetical protein [Alphaproteobacteria bacterium]